MLPAVPRGRGGLSPRTVILRVIVLHSAGAPLRGLLVPTNAP